MGNLITKALHVAAHAAGKAAGPANYGSAYAAVLKAAGVKPPTFYPVAGGPMGFVFLPIAA
jgi:hypothetical protein